MKINKIILVLIITLLSLNFNAQEILVSNIDEYKTAIKAAKPGTTIILKNGEWKDVFLQAYGKGTKDKPIVVKAQEPGKVIIKGNSALQIYGEYVIVGGLWFKDGATTSKAVVEFRKNSKEYANNCRLTNTTISYFGLKEGTDLKNHWVDIFGKNNRVDHCNFTGKRSEGTTLVVWLRDEFSTDNNHKIDNNYFGERPDLGKNGGETIRIGTSTNSMKSSKTIVEKNVFANCDGEIEIISNKSCNNIIRENLFIESKGTITLRHGNGALVENNVFLGNGVSNTGGIRVIGEDHIVRNNLLIGLAGDGFRGPITVMNGVPNSPLNRYFQVKNADIQNNTIINCGPIVFGAGKDDERSLPPLNSVFANNVVVNSGAGKIYEIEDDKNSISFSGNIVDSNAVLIDDAYFQKATLNWNIVQSFPIPTDDNPALKSAKQNSKSPKQDITNADRSIYVAGAFNLGGSKLPKALSLRSGPGWKPEIIAPKMPIEEITVEPGTETLRKAISNANPGSILNLKAGGYVLEKTIKVTKNLTINGAKDGNSIIYAQKNLEKELSYMFRVQPNVKLNLNNIILDGLSGNLKYAIVSPDKNEGELYNLFVNDVTFKNFINKNGGSIFKAYEGTKADTLSFVNSKFEDSYRGLNLSYDKALLAFSANTIIVQNSVFKNIEEHAINYIRNIPNVSVVGGKLIVENSVFSSVYNSEKGKIIRTDGIHEVIIKNAVFVDSYKVKTPISLNGFNNSISNSLFDDSGFLKTSQGAKENDILYKNPRWENKDKFIPSKNSPLLKVNNGNATIGLKQE